MGADWIWAQDTIACVGRNLRMKPHHLYGKTGFETSSILPWYACRSGGGRCLGGIPAHACSRANWLVNYAESRRGLFAHLRHSTTAPVGVLFFDRKLPWGKTAWDFTTPTPLAHVATVRRSDPRVEESDFFYFWRGGCECVSRAIRSHGRQIRTCASRAAFGPTRMAGSQMVTANFNDFTMWRNRFPDGPFAECGDNRRYDSDGGWNTGMVFTIRTRVPNACICPFTGKCFATWT